MKFFPGLMKVLAAAGAAALYAVINAVREYFASAVPSDISAMLWAGISFVAILVLNFALGKLPKPVK